jgi:hypothetical protein
MKVVDRQKICTHCDGRIAIESEHCPYCGSVAAIPEEVKTPTPLFDHQSIQDSLTSLYTPPYSNKSSPYMKQDKEKSPPKQTPRESHESRINASLGKINISGSTGVSIEEKIEGKSSFAPLLFLLFGGNLLIIGLLQFFFSERGVLRLEWDSTYWFIYCLIAIPAIYFGLKKANQCEEKE